MCRGDGRISQIKYLLSAFLVLKLEVLQDCKHLQQKLSKLLKKKVLNAKYL